MGCQEKAAETTRDEKFEGRKEIHQVERSGEEKGPQREQHQSRELRISLYSVWGCARRKMQEMEPQKNEVGLVTSFVIPAQKDIVFSTVSDRKHLKV